MSKSDLTRIYLERDQKGQITLKGSFFATNSIVKKNPLNPTLQEPEDEKIIA